MRIFKNVRYHAEGVMNIWQAAEMGERKAKKKHKRDIRKQQRVLEKRIAARHVNEYKAIKERAKVAGSFSFV